MTRLMLLLMSVWVCACGSRARTTAPTTPSSYDAPSTAHVDAGLLTPAEAAEVDRLILGLFNEDVGTRTISAKRLARLGPKARPALSYLVDCVVTDATGAGSACADAAAAIGEDGRERLRALTCMSRDDIATVAIAALDEPAACVPKA